MKRYILIPLLLFSITVLGQQTLCEECDSLYRYGKMKQYFRTCTVDDTISKDIESYKMVKKYLCENKLGYSTYKISDSIPILLYHVYDIKDTVFTTTEKMPEFIGGKMEFQKFLIRNIVYPRVAEKKEIAGKVYVEFIITKSGEIVNVKLRKGVESSLDNEAISVVKLMPKWQPGEYNGVPVNFKKILPINYALPE